MRVGLLYKIIIIIERMKKIRVGLVSIMREVKDDGNLYWLFICYIGFYGFLREFIQENIRLYVI